MNKKLIFTVMGKLILFLCWMLVLGASSGCNLLKQEVTVVEERKPKPGLGTQFKDEPESKESCIKRMEVIFKMCVEDCEGTQSQRDACMKECQNSLARNMESDCGIRQ